MSAKESDDQSVPRSVYFGHRSDPGSRHTEQFAVSGQLYEIDLTDAEEITYRTVLGYYMDRARRIGLIPTQRRRGPKRTAAVWVDPKKLRAWCEWKKIPVNPHGIPHPSPVRAYLKDWLEGKIPVEFL